MTVLMKVVVKAIPAPATQPLRHLILRPNQPVDECIYPGDEDSGTAHFGAFLEGKLIGVASIYNQSLEGEGSPDVWRIRGMVTLEEMRGRGCGGRLLEACFDHAQSHNGDEIWCNARTTVMGFYERFGFRKQGEEFDLPGIGPHFVMVAKLDGDLNLPAGSGAVREYTLRATH